MTEKEKAKAYDEALKKASAVYKDEDRHLKATLGRIFPELKESDDEEMRNFIISGLTCLRVTYKKGSDIYKKLTDAIAWVEKQGKTSPILSNSLNTEKSEQKSADKPRFKVGDWVVFIPSKSVYQIEKQKNNGYTLRNILGNSFYLSFFSKELIRKWTIQDAEDGDIVCYKDEVSLYKNKIEDYNKQETTFGGFTYYCCYDGKRFITNDFYLLTEQDEIDIYPATKKQRDILMKAMNNAGYIWDSEKKELKNSLK